LHNLPDAALGNQFRRPCHRWHFETFREVYRPDATRLCNAGLDGSKLIKGRAARFVGHHVLASAHRLDSAVGSADRHISDQDHVDLGIVQQFPSVGEPWDVWEPFREPLQRLRLAFRPPTLAGTAKRLHFIKLAKDVPVINADHAEFERLHISIL
jgi:hypothetical protein